MRIRLITSIFISLLVGIQSLDAQVIDTISDWDGISANWESWSSPIDIVDNPHQDTINPTEHCVRLTTSSDLYDLMLLNLSYTVNFDEFPTYSLLCYPPAEGGNVVLKFENSDVTDWQEIQVSMIGGQWNRLDFDFSGLAYSNFTRMVIFYDFLGTSTGNVWYFDEITRQSPVPFQFDSNLPLVVINTNGLEILDDPKITAHMGIINNGEGNRNHLSDPFNDYNGYIGIEIRGQSSQMFPKKSYGVETRDSLGENLDVSLLGLPAENDWILYAPYTDKSLMRNTLSYLIGERTGEYCTRNVYCELVINNNYKGIYVLEEKVKKDKNRVDIATLNSDEIAGDDLTGGYILSVDKVPEGFVFGVDGWLSAPYPSYPDAMDIIFQYYYPEVDKLASQQKNYIRNFITEGEKALISPSFKDPSTGYQKYFDAPSFIDFMLLSEISKEVDKYRYSTFFYKQKDSDGGKLFAGPAWDFDLGYGNVDYWDPGIDYTGWLYEMVHPWDYSIIYWWKRMMEDPYFRDLAKTRWTLLRADKLSNSNLESVIDSITGLTEEARIRNFERWPILGVYVWPNYNWQNNTYEDEVEYFRNFLLNRVSWMDKALSGKVLQPYASVSAQGNKIYCKIEGDYFRNPILKNKYFRLNDNPFSIFIDTVLYSGPNECVINLSGDVMSHLDISVTVDKKILNTWDDLTSNKLSSAGIIQPEPITLKAFYREKNIHILCSDPEKIPPAAILYSSSGQQIDEYPLQNVSENVLPCKASAGVYYLRITGISWQKVIKLVVN